jgi:hypothetical protein
MSLNKVTVVENFLTVQECQELNDWADAAVVNGWLGDGVDIFNVGQGQPLRKTTRGYESLFTFPPVVQTISDKITARFNLQALTKSADGGGLGVTCTLTLPGGSIVGHTDPFESSGTLHLLRCNILTRASDAGGVLLLSGVEVPLNAGDLISYSPSHIKHSVSTVGEGASRVMWLFGYQLPNDFFRAPVAG